MTDVLRLPSWAFSGVCSPCMQRVLAKSRQKASKALCRGWTQSLRARAPAASRLQEWILSFSAQLSLHCWRDPLLGARQTSGSAACAVFTFTSDLQMHLQVVNRSTGHLRLKSLSTLFLHTHSGKLSSGRRLSPCSRDGMSAVAGKASCQWLHCGVQDHEVFFKMSSRAYGSHNRTRANEANALKPYAILVITAIHKARHQS